MASFESRRRSGKCQEAEANRVLCARCRVIYRKVLYQEISCGPPMSAATRPPQAEKAAKWKPGERIEPFDAPAGTSRVYM